MGSNQSRSREPQEDGPNSARAEVLTTSADGRVEIKKDDLGPNEQEVFRKFADKVKNVTDQSSAEMIQTLHAEVGQHVDEDAWMGQAYVRIGIVGVSDAGKSTFINSFRGLRAREPGAAAVGTTETTTDTAEYPHPENDHVILVDFPGALFKLKGGSWQSVTFNMKEYTRKFERKMRECNVFLVFTSGRVHDNAVWIAAKAKEIGKKVLFVRSKFDQDVKNKQDDEPACFEGRGGQEEGENRLLQFQRQDYVTKLETMGYGRVAPEDVFIISGKLVNIQRGRWDAPALKEAMLKQLNIQQQMLFISTCQDFSPTMARAKAKIYKSRAWKVALGVAAVGAIPLGGTPINAGVMATTVMLFKGGFGLFETSVQELATLTGKDAAELQRLVDEKMSPINKITQFFRGNTDWQSIKQALVAAGAGGIFAASIAVDAAIDTSVPFVGGLVTAPASFGLAWKALNLVIEQQEACALALYELAFR
ncbi:interferon-gamma-inducible GTPase 10-like [Branchiostoma floridae x Branchiostoma japonicum]